tara:strand:- start:192 stop:329 length:138 start_codon:yes stop_codon:yes gene_type:complete
MGVTLKDQQILSMGEEEVEGWKPAIVKEHRNFQFSLYFSSAFLVA